MLSRAHPQSAAPVAFCQSGSELRNTLSLSLRLSSDERADCSLDRIQTSLLDLLSELQESWTQENPSVCVALEVRCL